MTPSDPTIPRLPDGESKTVELRPGGQTASTDFTVVGPAPKVLGDFELLAEVGRGGMGRVYKARQRSLNRIVALKTILTRGPAKPAIIQRFKKEAEAAAQLDHPGIVPINEFRECGGVHFFTMAFVDGKSLDDRLERGPLDNRMAALVTEKVAEAVSYAHAKGVVHRDLKPGNVLLGRDGSVKVTDFGLARRFTVETGDDFDPDMEMSPNGSAFSRRLTLAGSVMGTPGYIAPEQVTDSRQAGPAADIWAIGAILYSCLTGKPPFIAAGAAETLVLVLESEPPAPRQLNPDCDPDLELICLKCLRKDLTHRYTSAQELAEDLKHWREGLPIRSKRLTSMTRLGRFLDASPEVIAIFAGLIVHRFSNIQDGVFVGCALFGMSVADRRSTFRGPMLVSIALAIAFLALMVSAQFVKGSWIESYAYLLSSVATAMAIATIGLGMAAIEPSRAGRWGPRRIAAWTLSIGVVGLFAAWTVSMAADGLHLAIANGEPSPIYSMTWTPAAQFFFILLAFAVIFSFAVLFMLGVARTADFLSRRAGADRRLVLLAGGAAVLVFVAWMAILFHIRWSEMFDAERRLRIEPGSPWFEAVIGLDRSLGRFASWFFAIGMGLSIGALVGGNSALVAPVRSQTRQPSAIPAIVGAACGALVAQILLGQIRSAEPAEVAKFSFWGSGPALSVAEDWTVFQFRMHSGRSGSDLLWVAALGIYWLKLLLLTAPMALGATIGAVAPRLAGLRAAR